MDPGDTRDGGSVFITAGESTAGIASGGGTAGGPECQTPDAQQCMSGGCELCADCDLSGLPHCMDEPCTTTCFDCGQYSHCGGGPAAGGFVAFTGGFARSGTNAKGGAIEINKRDSWSHEPGLVHHAAEGTSNSGGAIALSEL